MLLATAKIIDEKILGWNNSFLEDGTTPVFEVTLKIKAKLDKLLTSFTKQFALEQEQS